MYTPTCTLLCIFQQLAFSKTLKQLKILKNYKVNILKHTISSIVPVPPPICTVLSVMVVEGLILFHLRLCSVWNFLFSVLSLSCSMWDLHCSAQPLKLQHKSLVVLRHVGSQFPNQGLNQPTSPKLQGKFVTTGSPGKCLIMDFLALMFLYFK